MKHPRRILLPVLLCLLLLSGCGGTDNANNPGTGAPQANPPAVSENIPAAIDPSTWPINERTSNGLTYSYRYPAGWTADLAYCAPGAARTAGSNELPARCAATDILIGQKAIDVGTLRGNVTNLTIDGKQAQKQIDDHPRNGMAARIYTVMIYDGTGQPLFGFATSIGPGTDTATQNNITAVLDQIASTLTVGR